MPTFAPGASLTYKQQFKQNCERLATEDHPTPPPDSSQQKGREMLGRMKFWKRSNNRELVGFNPSSFFYRGDPSKEEEKFSLKIEADYHYQAKDFEEVRGTLFLNYDCLKFVSVMKDISFQVDYLDIANLVKYPIDNEDAVLTMDDFIMKNHAKKWLLEIKLSAFNGLTTTNGAEAAYLSGDGSIKNRSEKAIASIFLLMMHHSPTNSDYMLIDREQELVLNQLIANIRSFQQNCQIHGCTSMTFVPYFDTHLTE